MKEFLKETQKWNKFELLIDLKIFSNEIVLKAAYNFLDKGYFFFFINEDKNLVLQFTRKDWVEENPEDIIWDFSDELLSVYLRDRLEKSNKEIREKIVWAAIANSLESQDFVQFDTDNCWCDDQNQIDFDKDIEDILKEIENDPELKIDEDEIERILKEIESETENEIKKDKENKWDKKSNSNPKIDEDDELSVMVDIEAVKDLKEKFKKNKDTKKTKNKK